VTAIRMSLWEFTSAKLGCLCHIFVDIHINLSLTRVATFTSIRCFSKSRWCINLNTYLECVINVGIWFRRVVMFSLHQECKRKARILELSFANSLDIRQML
jgi:hypothetical protein